MGRCSDLGKCSFASPPAKYSVMDLLLKFLDNRNGEDQNP
ncbi:hypothetical protein BAK_3874 [Bacillus anthracis str. A0389]|nr:hypothetical protein BAMEG_0843 [Bacillus anthracis str. CDC 684]EDR85560.1 hypothetical protein BAQ_3822 [Bacillus anthracis str. A0193]EDS94805.1 hypothetical protein BAK_3874 [Bacillus anthracis str. A0389]EDT65206.1 hypothetical protein BAO_3781 [Bacillus anthracis str. A0174]